MPKQPEAIRRPRRKASVNRVDSDFFSRNVRRRGRRGRWDDPHLRRGRGVSGVPLLRAARDDQMFVREADLLERAYEKNGVCMVWRERYHFGTRVLIRYW